MGKKNGDRAIFGSAFYFVYKAEYTLPLKPQDQAPAEDTALWKGVVH